MAITLPTSIVKATTQDPKNLILFGAPKVGKTTILSTLENCLILDFEQGSDYVDALKLKVDSVAALKEICVEIKKAGKPYKFIAIDTITALAEFVKPIALKDYLATEAGQKNLAKLMTQGKSEKDINLLTLPFGAGYLHIKDAINKVIKLVSQVTDHVIIVGHVKLSAVDGGDESDVSKNLDLPGQAKRSLAAESDAIGFVYRDENSNLCINFSSDGVECGARPRHLANQRIVVAEMQEDGSFAPYWDRVYPSLN